MMFYESYLAVRLDVELPELGGWCGGWGPAAAAAAPSPSASLKGNYKECYSFYTLYGTREKSLIFYFSQEHILVYPKKVANSGYIPFLS